MAPRCPCSNGRASKARFATHRYHWLKDVPLRDGKDTMLVNRLEIEIVDPLGKVTYATASSPTWP
jgi:hypothetical protein